MPDRRGTLVRAAQVLGAAVVGLQSGEPQAGRHHLVRERTGGSGRNAAAPLADVDLDEHVGLAARGSQREGKLLHAKRRVDRNADPDAPRQLGQPGELVRRNHFVADVDVRHALGGEALRLADLLYTHTDRAGVDLQPRDGRALVHLRVGAQAHLVIARERGHALQVALHCIEVDHERRRVDRVDRVGSTNAHGTVPCSAAVWASLDSSSELSSRWQVSLQPISVKPCSV